MESVMESVQQQIKKAKTLEQLDVILDATKRWEYVLPRTKRQWTKLANQKRSELGVVEINVPAAPVIQQETKPSGTTSKEKQKRQYKAKKEK